MTAATFDTFNPLKYAKKLEAGKVPPEQAEAQAEALREILEERDRASVEQAQALAALQMQLKNQEESHKKDAEQMATKGDLRELDTKLTGEIALVRKEIAIGNKDLLIKLGSGLIAAVTLIFGAIGLAVRYLSQLPVPH